jgi:hypothetical protein
MINADRKSFFKLIADISAFYRKDFSEFSGTVWWEAMKPYDFVAVSEALNRHCINPDVGQFMPFPADGVRMLQGRTQDQASIAWAKVDSAVRKVGTYRDVVFDDALIHRVISEMGGWIQIGSKGNDEWPFVAKEFETRYRGYRMRGENPEFPPVLIGLANSQNAVNGHKGQEPVLIGDTKKAQDVMLLGTDKPLLSMQSLSDIGKAISTPSLRRLA